MDVFFALSVEKYYKNRENSIGKNGDFITAPEVSQMFCHAVAVWVYNQIYNLKGNVSLVELGGGNGTLMNEILTFFKKEFILQEVYFIETSPIMIEKQKNAVSSHMHTKFYWVDSIDKIPSNFKHVIIANEFFDALPIKQFINCGENFREIYISSDIKLIQSEYVISCDEMKKIMKYSNLKVDECNQGFIAELSIASLTILDKICKIASAALIIDYGYYNQKGKNTIKTIANHSILDSFMTMSGSTDISAEVDFGALENFIKKNYSSYNIYYTNQTQFLEDHHINIIAERTRKEAKNQRELDMINDELNKISVEMGEKFKVLSLNSR